MENVKKWRCECNTVNTFLRRKKKNRTNRHKNLTTVGRYTPHEKWNKTSAPEVWTEPVSGNPTYWEGSGFRRFCSQGAESYVILRGKHFCVLKVFFLKMNLLWDKRILVYFEGALSHLCTLKVCVCTLKLYLGTLKVYLCNLKVFFYSVLLWKYTFPLWRYSFVNWTCFFCFEI